MCCDEDQITPGHLKRTPVADSLSMLKQNARYAIETVANIDTSVRVIMHKIYSADSNGLPTVLQPDWWMHRNTLGLTSILSEPQRNKTGPNQPQAVRTPFATSAPRHARSQKPYTISFPIRSLNTCRKPRSFTLTFDHHSSNLKIIQDLDFQYSRQSKTWTDLAFDHRAVSGQCRTRAYAGLT